MILRLPTNLKDVPTRHNTSPLELQTVDDFKNFLYSYSSAKQALTISIPPDTKHTCYTKEKNSKKQECSLYSVSPTRMAFQTRPVFETEYF